MERLRTPGPAEGPSVVTLPPLADAPSLATLRETLSSPGVLQEDVDALLQGLARPLAENESPRARADFLLSVLESPGASAHKGRDGRSVRVAAVEALLDLGYPYALEVPPEALAELQRHREDSAPRDIPHAGIVAACLAMLAQLVPFLSPLLELLAGEQNTSPFPGLLLLGILWGPALCALLGGWLRSRGLQRLGLITMTLLGTLWLSAFALAASTGLHDPVTALSSLVSGLSLVAGAILLRNPEWLAQQDTSLRTGTAEDPPPVSPGAVPPADAE